MRTILPCLALALLCACSTGDGYVTHKVHSVLPLIQEAIEEGDIIESQPPELLNPWVTALGRSKVVAELKSSVLEMPDFRRASLWMLKGYAPGHT